MLHINEALYPLSVKAVNKHFDTHVPTRFFERLFDEEIDEIYPIVERKRFGYTALAYVLSPQAAQKLLSLVGTSRRVPMNDLVLIKLLDLMQGCYTANPLLVITPKTSKPALLHADDSDLQYDHETVKGALPSHQNECRYFSILFFWSLKRIILRE
jgi:hypothetical protein